jgi:thiol-disulfide isomerase/thioredoxin
MKKILYISANWCAPCKAFKPIVAEVTQELGIPVEYIDIDANPDIAEKYGVRSIPTTILLNESGVVFKTSGAMTKTQLRSSLV